MDTLDDVLLDTQIDDIEYWEKLYCMHPSSLTVMRTDQSDFQQRQVIVYLDDEKIGELMFGDAMSRDIAPGPHRLRVSNTLVWKTVNFDVKPGEQVRFEVINRPGKLTYPMLLIIGAGPLYLTLRRVA
jgi:hypothetical protein